MKITKVTDIDKKKIVLDGCMVTFSGIVFDLMNPDPDLIRLEDIAHGLAFNCRWNGATKRYYSIAEHSLRVSRRCVSPGMQLAGLLHDAEEAYWGDMIKPLKEIIRINSPEVLERMVDLRHLIFKKFNIPYCDTSKEDWDELVWDFENLILNDNIITLAPVLAERTWIQYYKNFS